ncbi:MAG TPA: polysaccharide deacetylase family protein [Chryseosolibacter sp.]|nr:polysaccharide deacetylase family protein [Chryseosolibacter sp.]
MKNIVLTLALLLISFTVPAQQTIQERLGYPKNTKLLIIHADDLGVAHSENVASFQAMEKGVVNSASIMMPCPWVPEVAEYAKQHPQADFGLHLTITSEWKHYKWGPLLQNDVKTLLTDKGYLTDGSVNLAQTARLEEVERELRAQIELAKKFGIDITHLDSHMGMLFASPALLEIYIKLGRENKVPVLLTDRLGPLDLKQIDPRKDVVVDQVYILSPGDFARGTKNFYMKVLTEMQPGLNIILLHAAFDDSEMQAITVDHPDYGAAWRQADFDFFTSDECKNVIKEQNIRLVTWREIRDKLMR